MMCYLKRINRNSKYTESSEYPSYLENSKSELKKSSSTSSGDRRLAQSAQMYHYQHQKQQMIAMEK